MFSHISYNFCWPLQTLRIQEEEKRWQKWTMAMAAGLTDQVWSLTEWMRYPARRVQCKSVTTENSTVFEMRPIPARLNSILG